MKKWIFLNLIIAATFILGACSTSNNVVSNKLISKRKYNKGFHINKKSNLKDSDKTIAAVDVKDESSKVSDRKARKAQTSKVEPVQTSYGTETASNEFEESENVSASNQAYTYSSSEDGADFVEENEIENSVESSSSVTDETQIESNENAGSGAQPDMGDPVWLIIMILLALILPPVAIAIYSGITGVFWLDLILFLLAWGGFWFFRLSGILHLAAVIIAFLVIFDVI